jgi:hypothetical protein
MRGIEPKRIGLLGLILAGALLAVSTRPASADVIVGGTGNDNVFPFGNGFYTGEYQQLYAASAFPGSVVINAVSFESLRLLTTGSETLTFSLGLSTSPSSLSSPSSTFALNKGADFTTVFNSSITFTALNNGTFDLVIPTAPFTYNPAGGNLLMDVVITGSSGVGVAGFNFGASPNVSRIYWVGGDPISGSRDVGVGEGLLTRFSTSAIATVPEPGVVMQCSILGLVLCAGASKRVRGRIFAK